MNTKHQPLPTTGMGILVYEIPVYKIPEEISGLSKNVAFLSIYNMQVLVYCMLHFLKMLRECQDKNFKN